MLMLTHEFRWEDGLFVFPMEVGDDGRELNLPGVAISSGMLLPLRLGLLSAVAEWQPQSQRAQRTKVAVLRDLMVWVTTTDSSTQQIRPSHRATGLAKVGTK